MSFIVKGFDIPKDAVYFKLSFYDGNRENEYGVSGSLKPYIIQIPKGHGENDMGVTNLEEAFKELLDYIGVYDLGVQRWVDEENGLWYDRKEHDHISITEVLYRAKDAIEW